MYFISDFLKPIFTVLAYDITAYVTAAVLLIAGILFLFLAVGEFNKGYFKLKRLVNGKNKAASDKSDRIRNNAFIYINRIKGDDSALKSAYLGSRLRLVPYLYVVFAVILPIVFLLFGMACRAEYQHILINGLFMILVSLSISAVIYFTNRKRVAISSALIKAAKNVFDHNGDNLKNVAVSDIKTQDYDKPDVVMTEDSDDACEYRDGAAISVKTLAEIADLFKNSRKKATQKRRYRRNDEYLKIIDECLNSLRDSK